MISLPMQSGLMMNTRSLDLSKEDEMSITKILGDFWKVTLPIGKQESPIEVLPNSLDSYSTEFLYYNSSVDGVVFRCPTNGVTTSGSNYPRCEARQMDSNTKLSSWSTLAGRNRLTVVLSLDEIPIGPKREVVLMQVHGGDDDVATFRFNGSTASLTEGDLWITNGNNSRAFKIGRIKLGERIKIGFDVQNGKIGFNFNDSVLPFIVESSDPTCFFKFGCYVQVKSFTPLPNGKPDGGQVTVFKVRLNEAHEEPETPTGEFETAVLQELAEIKEILARFIVEHDTRMSRIKEAF